MSIFMKATLRVNPYQAEEFLKVLRKNLIPMMEERGWRLHACFVGRFGPINPMVVTDIWEMEDMAHVERVLKDFSYLSDPRFQASQSTLESAVLQEEVEFMELKAGRLETCYA